MLFVATIERSQEQEICPRCHGLLVLDEMSDIESILGKDLCFTLRCLNCGSVRDPLNGYMRNA